jgi:hypothetical protein
MEYTHSGTAWVLRCYQGDAGVSLCKWCSELGNQIVAVVGCQLQFYSIVLIHFHMYSADIKNGIINHAYLSLIITNMIVITSLLIKPLGHLLKQL